MTDRATTAISTVAEEGLVRPAKPSRRRHHRRFSFGSLLAAPAAVLVVVGLVIPVLLTLEQSFHQALGYGAIGKGFSLQSYSYALHSSLYRSTIFNALYVGALAGIVALLVSYPVAYYLAFKAGRNRNLIMLLMIASMFSSYLVRIFAWRTILGENGLINSALKGLGLIHHPLMFFLFSKTAIVIVLTNVFVPMIVLLLTAAMQNIDPGLFENARDLGANGVKVLAKVLLPLTMGTAISAFCYTYVLSAGDYVTPQLVGGKGGILVGVAISDQYLRLGNGPIGAALSFITLATFVVTFAVLWQLRRLKFRWV
jgi:spermidine/putrescine transport system permease protein